MMFDPRFPPARVDLPVKDADPADMVERPPHYRFGKIEVIDVLEDWFPDRPLLWQVVKYVARAGRKGSAVEDLRKARWYLDRQIRHLELQGSLRNLEPRP